MALDPYAEVSVRAIGGEWADLLDGKAPGHRLVSEWGEAFQSFQGARTRASDDGNDFFTLVYNERHQAAADWFGARGWRAVATALNDYLREVGRSVPPPGTEAETMTSGITLVRAVKA